MTPIWTFHPPLPPSTKIMTSPNIKSWQILVPKIIRCAFFIFFLVWCMFALYLLLISLIVISIKQNRKSITYNLTGKDKRHLQACTGTICSTTSCSRYLEQTEVMSYLSLINWISLHCFNFWPTLYISLTKSVKFRTVVNEGLRIKMDGHS